MSFLKKFISDNIVDLGDHHEDVQTAVKKPTQSNPQGQRPAPASTTQWQDSSIVSNVQSIPGMPTISTPISSTVLDQARQHFKDTIKDYHDKHLQTDYYVFEAAKEAMKSYVPVEGDRYKMAFATLATTGLTKDIIMQTGQSFLGVVDSELNSFSATFDPTFKQQVEDKKAVIQQKQQQMMDLSKQIQDLNEEIKKMNDDVIQSEDSLNNAKSAFVRAGADAKNEITTELQKIDQYIQ